MCVLDSILLVLPFKPPHLMPMSQGIHTHIPFWLPDYFESQTPKGQENVVRTFIIGSLAYKNSEKKFYEDRENIVILE